jgi:thiamine-phosphate pyrophosphorylase
VPFFAIGGLHDENIDEALRAGAERVCALRAIADAANPEAAAKSIRAHLDAAGGR